MTLKVSDVNRNSSLRNTYIAMHTDYFKMALYFSYLVMKLVNNCRKLFDTETITVKLKDGFLLNVVLCICPLIFINEAFQLVASVWFSYHT